MWWPPVINWSPPHNNWWPQLINWRPPHNNWWPPVINWSPPHNNWWPRVINWSPPHNNWWPRVINWSPPYNNWWPRVINWSPPHNNWWPRVINWSPPHNNWWPRVINWSPPYNNWWPLVIMWWPRDNNWRIVRKYFTYVPREPPYQRATVLITTNYLMVLFIYKFIYHSTYMWVSFNDKPDWWGNFQFANIIHHQGMKHGKSKSHYPQVANFRHHGLNRLAWLHVIHAAPAMPVNTPLLRSHAGWNEITYFLA